MMKLIRPESPQWLTQNWERWSESYKRKLEDINRDNILIWATHEREKVNHKLLPLLREMTKDHCSFCDGFPMKSRIGDSIEHFKPKTRFPLESYKWENLFLCCGICQKKNEKFDERLLKPDEVEYEFSRYFDYNYQTGKLGPNKLSNEEDQERASITIELYGLNENDKPEDRKREFREYFNRLEPLPIDEIPYRFIFD